MPVKGMTSLIERLETLFKSLDRRSNGWLSELRRSMDRFSEMRGAEAAASLAYFALFSMFPLTLFFVALMGLLLGTEQAYRQTLIFMQTVFPFSSDFIRETLADVLDQGSTAGIVAALSFLWAASAFFSTLARNVNRAWPSVKLRGAMQSRLVAVGMIGALSFLLLLSLLSSTIINLLPRMVLYMGMNPSLLDSLPARGVLRLVPAFFTFLMFVGLYRWVPNRKVHWKAVFAGALLVTLAWELAKSGFTFYLSSGWINLERVYGTLGTLIGLLVWIYFSNILTLFGSYLVAAIDIRAEQKQPGRVYGTRMETGAHKELRG